MRKRNPSTTSYDFPIISHSMSQKRGRPQNLVPLPYIVLFCFHYPPHTLNWNILWGGELGKPALLCTACVFKFSSKVSCWPLPVQTATSAVPDRIFFLFSAHSFSLFCFSFQTFPPGFFSPFYFSEPMIQPLPVLFLLLLACFFMQHDFTKK